MRFTLFDDRSFHGGHLSRHGRGALTAICVLAIAPVMHAQFRASLTGTVTDPEGAVVPGATVTLTDLDNGRVVTAKSNEGGFYTFNALAPDHFSLKVVMAGFADRTITPLSIHPDSPNSADIKMALATNSQSVDVSANTVAPLETTTATIAGTVTSNEIQHMPSAGRDIFQLAQLAPGSFGDGSQGSGGGTFALSGTAGPGGTSASSGPFTTENQAQVIGNGQQNSTNGISIDGISTVSATWGGATVITPNEDSVEALRIATNSYDAENGRFSGSQIQVTTKSGTNQVHGSFFFRANRPGLNAYQRYNGPNSLLPGTPAERGLTRDTARYNDFGGSIGGPFW